MAKNGTLAIVARNKFYETASQKYGLVQLEIKRILLNAGFEGYVFEEEENYYKVLDEHCKVIKEPEKVKTPPVENKPKVQWPPQIIRDPCPVKGCKGYKNRESIGWSCSEGKRRHYWAMRSAAIILGRDATIEEVGARALEIVKGMDKLDAEQKARENKERALYEERLKESKAPTS